MMHCISEDGMMRRRTSGNGRSGYRAESGEIRVQRTGREKWSEVIFVPRNGRTQKFSSSKIALKPSTLGSTDTDPEPTTAPSVPDGSKVENSITAEKADGSAFTILNVEKSTATVHGGKH